MKKTLKTKSPAKIKEPRRDRDLPVTKRLLDLKIQEVKSETTALRLEMKAGFAQVDARFAKMDARFDQMDARFATMETQMTKMLVIVEEQNDRNRAAFDGYVAVYERFINTDERLDRLEKQVFGAKQR